MTEMLGLHGITYGDGTEKLITNRYGTFKVYNAVTGVWDNESGFGWDAGSLIDSENFLDHAFFVNGKDANRSLNAAGTWSATTNLLDSPVAKYIKKYNTRLYLGHIKINSTWYRSRIWFSDLPKDGGITWGLETGSDLAQTSSSAVVTSTGSAFITRNIKVGDPFVIEDGDNAGEYTVRTVDSETQITLTENLSNTDSSNTFWVGGNWFDVGTDDGDVITGFGKNSNELLPLKQLSLYRYNSQAGTLRQIKEVKGTPSNRSIIDENEYTYYYDSVSDAIRRCDGVNSIIISNAIEDIMQGITAGMRPNVVGFVRSGTVMEWYIGTVTTRDNIEILRCVIMWDTITETWSCRTLPFEIEQSTEWVQSNKLETFVGTSNGKVLRVNAGYKYGSKDMSFFLQDKPIFPEGEDVIVTFNKIRLFIENGHAIQLAYRILYAPVEGRGWKHTEWQAITGTTDAEKVELVFDSTKERRGSGLQLRVIQSSGEESFLFEEYVIYYSNPAIR